MGDQNNSLRRRPAPAASLSRERVVSSDSRGPAVRNVTEALRPDRLAAEIDNTEKSLKAIEREIQTVERRRRSVARSTPGTNDMDYDSEDDDAFFLRHSRPRTYRPYFSLFFLFSCLIVFVIEIAVNGWTIDELSRNPMIGPSVETLKRMGAKDGDGYADGEYWRLIAPIFLHVGIFHLLLNMVGLITLGLPMEQEFGTLRVALIAMISGVMGVILSSLLAPANVSVGASGAIFGLAGAGWGDLFQNWSIYEGKRAWMTFELASFTLVSFFLGLMPFVDNFAHLGGFLSGLILGMALLVKSYGEVKIRRGTQMFLRIFAAVGFPVAIGSLSFLLFVGFDASETCSWCSYLSCVPFPFRADEDDLWWDCTPCLNGFGDFVNFTRQQSVVILCPDGDEVLLGMQEDISVSEFESDFIRYCVEVCES